MNDSLLGKSFKLLYILINYYIFASLFIEKCVFVFNAQYFEYLFTHNDFRSNRKTKIVLFITGCSVARLIAPALGAGGRRFESCHPDRKPLFCKGFRHL